MRARSVHTGWQGIPRRGWRCWIALVCAVLACAVLPGAPAAADPGAPRAVHLTACVSPVRHGDRAEQVLNDRARFDCVRPSSAYGPGSFWVRFAIPTAVRSVPPGDLRLRFVPQWQRAMALYTRDEGGTVVGRWFGDEDLSRMVRIGPTIGLPLDGHNRPVTDALLRIDGAMNANGLVSDPQVLDQAGLHGEELVAVAVFAAFAGLGIGLFCYNLVLWLTIRERFQLTYCLSLLAMLAYVWSSSGAMAVQVPGVGHNVRLQTSYVMLAFVGALAMQFITDFIEPGKLPRLLRLAGRHFGLGCVAAAFAVVFAPEDWVYLADRAYVVAFVPLPPLVIALTVIAWRRGSAAVRVLAVAWIVPLLMAILRIAHSFHLVEFGTLVQYALVFAMSIEALLSSLAMSFRIKRLTDERDRALADEQSARHLASVDFLTGLLNRRAMLEQLIEWGSPEPLRMLLVDIDHFKMINDQHGHLTGDEVLREVAEVLAMRADLRGSVARLGGEEFAVIGTAEELGEGVALGILADLRSRAMAGKVRLTVSIGMADGMVRNEDEWRELYRRADAALYRAKSEGRNRAVHACAAGAANPPALRLPPGAAVA